MNPSRSSEHKLILEFMYVNQAWIRQTITYCCIKLVAILKGIWNIFDHTWSSNASFKITIVSFQVPFHYNFYGFADCSQSRFRASDVYKRMRRLLHYTILQKSKLGHTDGHLLKGFHDFGVVELLTSNGTKIIKAR